MNTPRPPASTSTENKLVVRSHVLAVIQHLATRDNLSKQERLKQLRRLKEIEPLTHVLDILVKELQRAKNQETLQVVTQLLMELGSLEYLRESLWAIIEAPTTSDEVKDTTNLILRHLGDTADPDLYLDYLEDPHGLISRETARMLEVSASNPEALIDFIDFILSLNVDDQVRLLASLQSDYASDHLINLYVPLLESDPIPEVWEQLVLNLAETRSPDAVVCLENLLQWSDDRLPIPRRLISKSLKQLQLACASGDGEKQATTRHAIVQNSEPDACYLTLSDGIGNQGVLFSRRLANDDVVVMSVAINDVHGIIDCFGFAQLSATDFNRIVEKFHEGTTPIKVSPAYVAYKLQKARAANTHNCFRIPYEYSCWSPVLKDIEPQERDALPEFTQWAKSDWFEETYNLYQHPDFVTWFLEQGDEPPVTRTLQQAGVLLEDYLGSSEPAAQIEVYAARLATLANELMLTMLDTPWRGLYVNRLAETAYLLDCQNTNTFRDLAATEVLKLQTLSNEACLTGFTLAFGRRCIAEELLRLRMGSPHHEVISALVDYVWSEWKL